MSLLLTGLGVWVVVHLFKRLAPSARASLGASVGEGAVKGVTALLLLSSVVLIVLGYRAMPDVLLYQPPAWGRHANEALMLVSIFLLGAGNGKGLTREKIRHPMLAGALVWSIGHLLANGWQASTILFATMGAWAVVSILLINMRDPEWNRPTGGTLKGDFIIFGIAIVLYGIIGVIHGYVGPSPFGGA